MESYYQSNDFERLEQGIIVLIVIFDSNTVATAIADRLFYNSEVLIMEGTSYRKRIK